MERKSRVRWSDDETRKLAKAVSEIGVTSLSKELVAIVNASQADALPDNRRRKIVHRSQLSSTFMQILDVCHRDYLANIQAKHLAGDATKAVETPVQVEEKPQEATIPEQIADLAQEVAKLRDDVRRILDLVYAQAGTPPAVNVEPRLVVDNISKPKRKMILLFGVAHSQKLSLQDKFPDVDFVSVNARYAALKRQCYEAVAVLVFVKSTPLTLRNLAIRSSGRHYKITGSTSEAVRILDCLNLKPLETQDIKAKEVA